MLSSILDCVLFVHYMCVCLCACFLLGFAICMILILYIYVCVCICLFVDNICYHYLYSFMLFYASHMTSIDYLEVFWPASS